ncbi:MAG: class I SAM-dependent methyltransferase [Phycisphaerales bacterium]|nr:class I SAM-dependent methyltransferase [Phycisphaerales bacterium]MCB9863118.1 class I SAM-dependent methyltransferase [Phycisphaerales bacterium]
MIAVAEPSIAFDACRACGRHDAVQRDCIRGHRIAQCPGCRLAWTHDARIDPATFYDAAYFEDANAPKGYNDYFAMAGAMQRTNRKRLNHIRRVAPKAKSLLDVGCGPGFFLREAVDRGFTSHGIEVSPFASDFGRRELQVNITTGAIDAGSLARVTESPDVITMWDTIEHLPDPDDALRRLAARLNPGGVICITTGDITSMAARITGSRWHLYNLPEHLWFFSPDALRCMLESAGLEVVNISSEICWYTAHYLVERLSYSAGIKTPRIPGASLLKRIPVPLTLFDIVFVTARKPA